MAIENIHLCLQRRWAITWEAKPSYFNPLTVFPPSPWVAPQISSHQPGGLRFDAVTQVALDLLLKISCRWHEPGQLHKLKAKWGVEKGAVGGKTEERAAGLLAGGNMRYCELLRLPDGTLLVLPRVRASAKELSYFPALHYSADGELLHHTCTCLFAGQTRELITRQLAEELAKVELRLASKNYIEQDTPISEPWLSDPATTKEMMKAECQGRKMLTGGNKLALRQRLLNPKDPASYLRGMVVRTLSDLQDSQVQLELQLTAKFANCGNEANVMWCAHQFCIPLQLSRVANGEAFISIAKKCPPPIRSRAKGWPLWYLEEQNGKLGNFLTVGQHPLGYDTQDFKVCLCGQYDDGKALHQCPRCTQSFHLRCLKAVRKDFSPLQPWVCPICSNSSKTIPQARSFKNYEDVLKLQRHVARLGLQVTEGQLASARLYAAEAGPEVHHILMRQGPEGLEPNNIDDPKVSDALLDFLRDLDPDDAVLPIAII